MKKYLLFILPVAFIILFTGAYFANDKTIKENENGSDDLKCQDCNLIVISLTNLKPSHLRNNGYLRDTAPNIDGFNERSIVFKNSFSPANWTRPAAASFFTSLYPGAHNVDVIDNNISPLDPKIPTLARLLKNNGYITASFNGGADYSAFYGFNSGFDIYESAQANYGGLESIVPPALDWLKQNKNNKFFLHIQSYDLHCPFFPPKPFDEKYDFDYKNPSLNFDTCFNSFQSQEPIDIGGQKYYRVYPIEVFGSPKNQFYANKEEVLISERDVEHLVSLYDGELNYIDSMIGSFFNELKAMRLYDNTIIVLMSEHGEIIGKKGRFIKGGPTRGTFYDDVINTLLSIYHPKIDQKKDIEGLVNLIDVTPTILDFLNISYESDRFQGKSLIPLIKNNKEINGFVFGGASYNGIFVEKYKKLFPEISSVNYIRSKKWKLIKELVYSDISRANIKEEKYELYDLEKDPEELNNLADQEIAIREELLEKLTGWEKETDIDYEQITTIPLPDDLKREMRIRGYQ